METEHCVLICSLRTQTNIKLNLMYRLSHFLNLLPCRFMLTRQQVLYGLERVELRSTSIFDSCPLKSRSGRQEVSL